MCNGELYEELVDIVDIIESMEWMVKHLKWKHREQQNIPEDMPDSVVNWSDELKKAIEILEKLKQE